MLNNYTTAFNAALERLAQTPALDTLHLHDETPKPEQRGAWQTEIVYDRHAHKYAMLLDSERIGFEETLHAADVVLTQLVHELQCGMYFKEAA
jgi:hypothetical protein